MTLFADKNLAERLEGFFGAELRRFVDTALRLAPHCEAVSLEVAGGVAAFINAESPLNQAGGLGLDGSVTGREIADIERFFASRGSRAVIAACPLAHPSLFDTAASRGWVAEGFENVLVRPLAHACDLELRSDDATPITVAPVESERERELWVHAAAIGFCAPFDPPPSQLELATLAANRPGSQLLLAYVGGAVAGTGELFIEDGVAWLSADSTLPHFRNRGVQHALQCARLQTAIEAGCRLAVSEAKPGSISQRNMERLGFRVAYTRVDLGAPEPGTLA